MHKVLIIEDDLKIQKNLEYLFYDRMSDCKVFLTSSVEEADSILDDEEVDLVVSDYNLGNEQNTLELIKGIDDSVKIIYLTGYLLREIVDLSLSKTNLFYMLKPYDNDELINLSLKLIRKNSLNENFSSNFMPDLIEGLSHEILNPLSVVYGYANKAKNKVSEDERLEKINSRIIEIKQKISLLKSVFQINYNLKLIQEFDPKAEMNFMLKNSFEEMDFEINGSEIFFNFNKNLFREIFFEIFQNVIDFSEGPKKPKVFINISESTDVLMIEVEDQCVPILDTIRIFNPYFSTKKTTVYNIGLGLTRVKYLLSHVQGEIDVLSLERGNKFKIQFNKRLA